ncbi:MAG TPA: hypothetical protein VEI02_14180, partial [Planctomycetota bacterium]|nr:hypothetical protein [Planctomycetota bacterium]
MRTALRLILRTAAALFGVAVAGFALVAAMGDPSEAIDPSDPRLAAVFEPDVALRARYPVDRPWFFNADPDDGPRWTAKRFAEVDAAAEAAGAVWEDAARRAGLADPRSAARDAVAASTRALMARGRA